jgi:hypothetical protein
MCAGKNAYLKKKILNVVLSAYGWKCQMMVIVLKKILYKFNKELSASKIKYNDFTAVCSKTVLMTPISNIKLCLHKYMLPIFLSLEDSSSLFYVFYTSQLIPIEEGILVFYLPLHFYKYSIKY